MSKFVANLDNLNYLDNSHNLNVWGRGPGGAGGAQDLNYSMYLDYLIPGLELNNLNTFNNFNNANNLNIWGGGPRFTL